MDANPDYVMKFLQGLEFPADRDRVVEHARTAGADGWIVATVEALPTARFADEAELRAAVEDVEVDRPAEKEFERAEEETAPSPEAGRALGGGTGRANQ